MKVFKISVLLSFIISLFWIFYLVIQPKFINAKEIKIPNFIGKDIEEVINDCDNLGVTTNIIYQETDSNGIVLTTFPKEDTLVKKNSILSLYVSKQKEITWPLYEGKFFDNVEKKIEYFCKENNLKYEIKHIVNNDLPENIIASQSQKYNTKLDESKMQIIEVVKHDNMIEFPDLVGLDLNEAINILNEFKLNFKCIYEQSVSPFNIVLEQSILPGTKILKGNQTEHILIISKGVENNFEIVGMNLYNACKLLEARHVSYEVIYVKSNEKNVVLDIDKYLFYDGYIDTIYLYVGY